MKSSFSTYGTASLLFLALVFAAFILLQPMYIAVENKFQDIKNDAVRFLEISFGLTVTCENISPSILSAIRLKNLDARIPGDTESLLGIKSIVVTYNPVSLIRAVISGRDILTAFRGITVNGTVIHYSGEKTASVIRKIDSFIKARSEKSSENPSLIPQDELNGVSQDRPPVSLPETLQNFFALPLRITLNSLTVRYRDDKLLSAELFLRRIQLENLPERHVIRAAISGSLSVTPLYGQFANTGKLTGGFSLSAEVDGDLSSFSTLVRLNSLNTPSFSVSRLNFICSYESGVLSAQLARSAVPLRLAAQWDTRAGDISVRLDIDRFDPFSLVTVKKPSESLLRFTGSSLGGTYTLKLNPSSGKISYTAAGVAAVSERLIPNGLRVSFDLSGDDKTVNIRSSQFLSPLIDASFEGLFDLGKKLPQGVASVRSLKLPNGNSLEAEIFIDQMENSVLFFMPQLALNDQLFTAVQALVIPNERSADFTFEAYDFTHEADETGKILLEGSILFGGGAYVQSSLSLSNMYADSLLRTAAFFVPPETGKRIAGFSELANSYIISNDIYFSTDFKTVTFNAPAMVIANTRRDREFLILSCSGNENSVTVSQLDLLAGGQSMQAVLQADFAPDFSNIAFNSVFTFNTITYSFQGMFFPGSYLGITGEYGFEFYIDFNNPQLATGQVKLAGLPVKLGETLVSASLDALLRFPDTGDWSVALTRIEVEQMSGLMAIRSKLSCSGNIDTQSFFLEEIIYADRNSTVSGNGGASWIFNEGTLDSVSANVLMENPQAGERIDLRFSAANPAALPLSAPSLLNQFYITLELSIVNLPFSRFAPNQLPNNTLTADLNISGTLNSPYVSARVLPSSFALNGIPLNFEGVVQLTEGQLTLEDSQVSIVAQKFSQLQASVSLDTFSGSASGIYTGSFATESLTAPFTVLLASSARNAGISESFATSLRGAALPDFFTLRMNLENMSGSLVKPGTSTVAVMERSPGRIDFSGGYDKGLQGYYLDDGTIWVVSGGTMPVRFFVSGTFVGRQLNIDLQDIYADASRLQPVLDFPVFSMKKGILNAELSITGLVTDPLINGSISLFDSSVSSEQFVSEYAAVSEAYFSVENNAIISREFSGKTKKGILFCTLTAEFNGWMFDNLQLKLRTADKTSVAANFNAPFGSFTADAACDLNILVKLDSTSVEGRLYLDNAVCLIALDNQAYVPPEKIVDTFVDLEIIAGKRSQVYWPSINNPILRGQVTPQTPMYVKVDTSVNSFEFKSDMMLRGGELLYLERNFYIRDGRVFFNINQDNLDPYITMRGETRERDENGEMVRIIISADNQPLSRFTPRLSSSPPKSEQQLMILLGQVLSADLTKSTAPLNDLLLKALDYGAQVFVFRKIENELRNFLNFDILSLRTSILQNVVRQTLDLNTSGKPFTVGNFFNNSTVYIGKYFGNSLFADMLLHVAYDENKLNSSLTPSGVLFQPEIGLEMASPFATIRWSLAPDLMAPNNLWVPYSSISVSWKFTF